jgi:hypothetical protein
VTPYPLQWVVLAVDSNGGANLHCAEVSRVVILSLRSPPATLNALLTVPLVIRMQDRRMTVGAVSDFVLSRSSGRQDVGDGGSVQPLSAVATEADDGLGR